MPNDLDESIDQWTSDNGPQVVDVIRKQLGDRLAMLGYDLGSIRAGPKAIDAIWYNGERYPLYTLMPLEPRPAMDTILCCIDQHLTRFRSTLHAFEKSLSDALGIHTMERIMNTLSGGSGEPQGIHINANPKMIPKNTTICRIINIPFICKKNDLSKKTSIEYDADGISDLQTALASVEDGTPVWLYIDTDSAHDKGYVDVTIYRKMQA